MQKLQIVVEGFEDVNDNFPIWCKIYVRSNDFVFPDEEWYDATTSILSMWSANITRLLLKSSDCVLLNFLDGDYAIHLTSLDNFYARASFHNTKGVARNNDQVDVVYLARQILAAAEKIKHYYRNETNHPFIDELTAQTDNLRSAIRKIKE